MATKTKRGDACGKCMGDCNRFRMGWAAWTAGNIARTSVSQEEVLTNNKMIIWR